jgi:hypothetical protein
MGPIGERPPPTPKPIGPKNGVLNDGCVALNLSRLEINNPLRALIENDMMKKPTARKLTDRKIGNNYESPLPPNNNIGLLHWSLHSMQVDLMTRLVGKMKDDPHKHLEKRELEYRTLQLLLEAERAQVAIVGLIGK